MLEQRTQSYLLNTLGEGAQILPWDQQGRLPAFLLSGYRFAILGLMGKKALLAIDESPEPNSPTVVRKHLEQVGLIWPGPIVYVREQVSATHRMRLVEQGVQFIVPGNQMFLPSIGIDFRETFRVRRQVRQQLRPATQAIFLSALLAKDESVYTASSFASKLRYSAMTISRALSELESADLVETSMSGRQRVMRFAECKRELWETAQPLLQDPVRSKQYVALPSGIPDVCAGESALAAYSNLQAPRHPVVAVESKVWNDSQSVLPNQDTQWPTPDSVMLEVWKYRPQVYRTTGVVEPLSLFLSLRDEQDERVQGALSRMMEEYKW